MRLPVGWLTGVLLCAFGIWMLPSVVMVVLAQTRSDLSVADLLTLLALTGMSATALRLTLGFWLQAGFGPALVFWALMALMVVSLGVAGLLVLGEAYGLTLAGLSVMVGLGGGGLAALSGPGALPDEETQYELEAASLVGHLGMVLTLLLVPYALMWPLAGVSAVRVHFLGWVGVGAPVWLVWSGVLWAGVCAVLLGLWCLFGRRGVSLKVPQWRRALLAVVLGLVVSALGAVVILPDSLGGRSPAVPVEVILPVLLALCVLIILGLTPAAQRSRVTQLLAHRHLWVMSALWVASLGTFLGLTISLVDFGAVPAAGRYWALRRGISVCLDASHGGHSDASAGKLGGASLGRHSDRRDRNTATDGRGGVPLRGPRSPRPFELPAG